jgi:hypothetical protein
MTKQPQTPFAAPPRNVPMQPPVKKPVIQQQATQQQEQKLTTSIDSAPNKTSMEGYQKSIASEPTGNEPPE